MMRLPILESSESCLAYLLARFSPLLDRQASSLCCISGYQKTGKLKIPVKGDKKKVGTLLCRGHRCGVAGSPSMLTGEMDVALV